MQIVSFDIKQYCKKAILFYTRYYGNTEKDQKSAFHKRRITKQLYILLYYFIGFFFYSNPFFTAIFVGDLRYFPAHEGEKTAYIYCLLVAPGHVCPKPVV